jgi:hypothetical protein
MLTGKEYHASSFAALHQRLAEALRGSRPHLVAELRQPDGTIELVFEGGQRQFVRGKREA